MSSQPQTTAAATKPISGAWLIIGSVATIAIIAMATAARIATYHVAPFFLIPALWAIYALRGWLHLRPVHFALLASALLLHMSGAFGFYQHWPLPFSFDILVHYYFALVGTLALHAALAGNFPLLRPWQLAVLTFFIMMGMAAMHEIMEYMSYLVLGEKNGMLKPSIMYFFDTQRDLTNNLLGTLTSLMLLRLIRPHKTPK